MNKRYREIEINNFKLNKNFAINNHKQIKHRLLIIIIFFKKLILSHKLKKIKRYNNKNNIKNVKSYI